MQFIYRREQLEGKVVKFIQGAGLWIDEMTSLQSFEHFSSFCRDNLVPCFFSMEHAPQVLLSRGRPNSCFCVLKLAQLNNSTDKLERDSIALLLDSKNDIQKIKLTEKIAWLCVPSHLIKEVKIEDIKKAMPKANILLLIDKVQDTHAKVFSLLNDALKFDAICTRHPMTWQSVFNARQMTDSVKSIV